MDVENNIVGGTTDLARNVVSGNGGIGVNILRSPGNQVQGNFIGTDVNGTATLGNQADYRLE